MSSDDRLKALEMLVDEHSKRIQIAEDDNTNLCTLMSFMAGSKTTMYTIGDAVDKTINKEEIDPDSYINLDMLYSEIVKIRTMIRSILGEDLYDRIDNVIEERYSARAPDMPAEPTEGLAGYVSMLLHPEIKEKDETAKNDNEQPTDDGHDDTRSVR